MFTDGEHESDTEEDAGGGSREVEIGRANGEEGRGESVGDEGEDSGGSKGEPGHEVCLSAERSMTGICVCCSFTLDDMVVR